MAFDSTQVASLTASFSSLAAVFSGLCAFLSYQLSKKIRDELKSDERIVTGVPIHPALREPAHSNCVIQCTLFNKSKRKAYIHAVSAFDRKGEKIDTTWSDVIDDLGNPQHPCQLIGIVDSCSLFLRRNDGVALEYAKLTIAHSFSDSPITLVHDEIAAWSTR